MSARIRTGDIEPILAFVRNRAGNPLIGATDLFIRLRRNSDGEYLDWSDQTFKAVGWTTLNQPLTQQDPTNAPGIYAVTGGLNTATIVNPNADDTYTIIPLQTPGTNALLPAPEEIKVGQWLDDLDDAALLARYYDGTDLAIHFDAAGVNGSTLGTNGTVANPCSTEANIIALLTAFQARGLDVKAIVLRGTFTLLTLTQAYIGFVFRGRGITAVIANGQDVSGSFFFDTGFLTPGPSSATTFVQLTRCFVNVNDGSLSTGEYVLCRVDNFHIRTGNFAVLRRCSNANPDSFETTFDCAGASAATTIVAFEWSGRCGIQNVANAGSRVDVEFLSGRAVIQATCSAGDVLLRGLAPPPQDFSTGATIDTTGLLDDILATVHGTGQWDDTGIAAAVWATDISGNSNKLTEAAGMLNLCRKAVSNRYTLTPGVPNGTFVLLDDDDSTPILNQLINDAVGGGIASSLLSPARRARTTI